MSEHVQQLETVRSAVRRIAAAAAPLEPAALATNATRGCDDGVYALLRERVRAAWVVVDGLESAGGLGQTEALAELVRRPDYQMLRLIAGSIDLALRTPPEIEGAWGLTTSYATELGRWALAWAETVAPGATWGVVRDPIEASSDDAALFELLARVGGAMPT
jgi:hypothetical protein